MNTKKKIYVASPLGFSEVGRLFMTQVIFPMLEELGYEIIDPWTLTDKKLIDEVLTLPPDQQAEGWRNLNPIIGKNNMEGIDKADGILAVLDGVDVDSGTSSEIGYGAAKGKPVLGYRGDFRLSADNVGGIVNLQVEYFIRLHGGTIVTEIEKVREFLPQVVPMAA